MILNMTLHKNLGSYLRMSLSNQGPHKRHGSGLQFQETSKSHRYDMTYRSWAVANSSILSSSSGERQRNLHALAASPLPTKSAAIASKEECRRLSS
jgi:hypothetical protein